MSQLNGSDWYLRLVDLAGERPSLWRRDEFAALWEHQLVAPLVTCIEQLGLVHALRCDTLCAALNPPIHSLQDLIRHPNPNAELFLLVGRWMERVLGDPKDLLPKDIALALLNVTVVMARIRCDRRLIAASDTDLAHRAQWVAELAWLDEHTRSQMQQAQFEFGGTGSGDEG